MVDKITVNEQSSIRIKSDKTLYFDPLHITGASHDAHLIFITHEHFDHFSPQDIEKVANENTLYVAPKSMAAALKNAGLQSEKCVLVAPGDNIEPPGVAVEAVAAYNISKAFHPKQNGWVGYVVNVCGSRVYVCGDTDDTPEARAVKCDVVCVPIGGTYTMDARQAAEFVNALSPKAAIPIHYGTIVGSAAAADEFEKLVNAPVVRKIKF